MLRGGMLRGVMGRGVMGRGGRSGRSGWLEMPAAQSAMNKHTGGRRLFIYLEGALSVCVCVFDYKKVKIKSQHAKSWKMWRSPGFKPARVFVSVDALQHVCVFVCTTCQPV